jgi:hypothetical protein
MTPPPPSLRDTSPNTTAKLHLPTQLSMSDLGEAGGGLESAWGDSNDPHRFWHTFMFIRR